MSRCYGERETTVSPLYLPPKPSCRRPLSRMVGTPRGGSPRPPAARYSYSPGSVSDSLLSISEATTRNNIYDDTNDSSYEYDVVDSRNDVEDFSSDDTDRIYDELAESPERPRLRTAITMRLSPSGSAAAKAGAATPPPKSGDRRASSAIPRERVSRPPDRSSLNLILCSLTLVTLVVVVASLYQDKLFDMMPDRSRGNVPSEKSEIKQDIEAFKKNVRKIREHFPSQDSRIWSDVAAGVIELINGSPEPWIFVLYSNETRELACLARMLGKASSEALKSDGSLQLHPRNLTDDYGLVIDRLKATIEAKRTVVVYDVLNIDPRSIQAFHTMCDRVTPLVKGAVYILTILTPDGKPEFAKPVDFVESQLKNRFVGKVSEEKLQPLITRLTDGPLIPVRSELGLTSCPL